MFEYHCRNKDQAQFKSRHTGDLRGGNGLTQVYHTKHGKGGVNVFSIRFVCKISASLACEQTHDCVIGEGKNQRA